jgi:hypothetical protein
LPSFLVSFPLLPSLSSLPPPFLPLPGKASAYGAAHHAVYALCGGREGGEVLVETYTP